MLDSLRTGTTNSSIIAQTNAMRRCNRKGYALEKDEFQTGLRVLVVEDEFLIGLLLDDMITEWGATLVGPFPSRATALAAAHQDNFDVALIDMNLGAERADDVAKLLADRGLPFALVSGSSEMPHSLGQTTVLQKPFTFADIDGILTQLSGARSRS